MRHFIMLMCGAMLTLSALAFTRTFTIQEPFGLDWGPDRVNYPVAFPQGAVTPDGITLTDAAGAPVAVQLSDIVLWPDKKTVKSAIASFIVALKPDATGTWTLTGSRKRVKQPATDLAVKEGRGTIQLTTAKVGIRVAGGVKQFKEGIGAEKLQAPVQGLRLFDGTWIGRGWWQTDRPCLGYRAEVIERGPVFARLRLQYEFTDATAYSAIIELSAGQEMAVISESFNISDGKAYEMPEQPGTKPGDLFRYVLPRFASPERAMLWDWWGGTGGNVPSPNCYHFSIYGGLQPERCEWYGRMYHLEPKVPQGANDTELRYDADARVISLNAFLNWGSDESLYFGAYNPMRADEVVITGLRPGSWINPDLDPHPLKTLVQWTQTNNLWIEQRATPDLTLRVPTCMGRRVYGIGVLQRHQTGEGERVAMTSDIMLRHIRYGRQRLDELKDWTLDYPETAKYPRLLVQPGDLAGLAKRAKANIKDTGTNRYISYLQKGDVASGERLVEETLTQLKDACRRIATQNWDHNSYAMSMPRLALAADVALGVPECTPEQARLIRRYVAACAYNTLSPDYVPPREAGYGWGSANMMEALRARGAAMMVSLLPDHPDGERWRTFLVKFLLSNAGLKISDAGATLEIGAYGQMALEFATIPFLALSKAGDEVPWDAILPRLRAAANHRLSYLLPHDVRGGFRPPAPIGDSPYHGENSLAYLIPVFAERDPDLAANLLWGVKESHAEMDSFGTPPGLLFDPDLQPRAPKLISTLFPGSGVVFRNGFPNANETYLNINGSGFAIGHGHPDRGCFILYAKGAPLMLDFASQYVPSMRETWNHNGGLTFNHEETVRRCPGRDKDGCFYQGKIWRDHTVEPFTNLQPGWDPDATNMDEVFGRITDFTSLPTADYCALERNISTLDRVPYMLPDTHQQLMLEEGGSESVRLEKPFTWTRRFVFVKSPDPLGPQYLVMRDHLGGNIELNPALNLWCLADALAMNGQTATFTGQHGVNLDIYVAEPAAFTHRTHQVGHTNGRQMSKYYQQTFGKPFKEEQTLFQIPQKPGGYFVALVPRRHADAVPTFANALNGEAITVSFGGRTDTVVLRNTPGTVTVDGLTLTGTGFVVTKVGGNTTVIMLAEGSVKRGNAILLAKPGAVLVP